LKSWKNDDRCISLILGAAVFSCSGVCHSFQTRWSYLSVVDRACLLPTKSILISALLPFFLSFVSLLFSRPVLLRTVYFFKCYLFAFCLGTVFTIPGAGLMSINSMILWCSFPSALMLHWFVFRHAFGFRKTAFRDVFLCMGLSLAVWLLYTCCVAPAAMMLTK